MYYANKFPEWDGQTLEEFLNKTENIRKKGTLYKGQDKAPNNVTQIIHKRIVDLTTLKDRNMSKWEKLNRYKVRSQAYAKRHRRKQKYITKKGNEYPLIFGEFIPVFVRDGEFRWYSTLINRFISEQEVDDTAFVYFHPNP
jgi:hypothetical protein